MADRNGIPLRTLGATGLDVTILGVGGYHIGVSNVSEEEGIGIIRTAIDEGVNFLDNAWCYNQGRSESVMGKALEDGYRDRVVLMTKNHGRDRATYTQQLEESLRRLRTDVIDGLQFHEVIHDGIPQQVLNEGPLEAAVRAREQGKIRFIGFTGHKWPRLFEQMLASEFDWQTAQMPVNLLDHHFRSFETNVLPVLVERGVGVIGMKSLAGTGPRILEAGVTAREAITYSLSLPIDVLVSGMDSVEVLKKNLAIVREFQPLEQRDRNELLARVAPFAKHGKLEQYKTG